MSGLQFLCFCALVFGAALGLVVLFRKMDGGPDGGN
jgi:hypothetical protein